MLRSLHIENIAVIRALDLDADGGFTAMTGETGAGKSIVIDSINFRSISVRKNGFYSRFNISGWRKYNSVEVGCKSCIVSKFDGVFSSGYQVHKYRFMCQPRATKVSGSGKSVFAYRFGFVVYFYKSRACSIRTVEKCKRISACVLHAYVFECQTATLANVGNIFVVRAQTIDIGFYRNAKRNDILGRFCLVV